MSHMPVFQLAYVSTFVPGRITGARCALKDIVMRSQSHNTEADVSGCLIFDGYTFCQILEGHRSSVHGTFERIARDRRHREIAVVGTRTSGHRSFGDFPMASYWRSLETDNSFLEMQSINSLDLRRLNEGGILALATHLSSVSEMAFSSSNAADLVE